MDTVRESLAVPVSEASLRCDRMLLASMVTAQIEQNRAHARRLEMMHTFHARRVTEREMARNDDAPAFFQLTPLRESQAEIAPLLAVGDMSVQIAIDTVEELLTWLPRLWQRCLSGRLDLSRAMVCQEQLVHLATDEDRRGYAEEIQDWFDRYDPPEGAEPLCPLTRTKIQRAARYRRLKFPRRSDQETFAQAFQKRRVSLRIDEEAGMASLTTALAAHDALTADHRLTLIAKHRAQTPGETRTLAQLRADTVLDLIHGRVTVPATTGALEHTETLQACGPACEGHASGPPGGEPPDSSETQAGCCPVHPLVITTATGGPIGGYARPVVNITLPFTTAVGYDDQPAVLSGGIAVPADLARRIIADPSSTWYRMVTDPVGNFIELTAGGYQPTPPIKNGVDARDQSCIYPSCERPAVLTEFEHRVPYPRGATSLANGQALCERHHQVKHASGYDVRRNPDGSYTWTTRHGSCFTKRPVEQPGVRPEVACGGRQDDPPDGGPVDDPPDLDRIVAPPGPASPEWSSAGERQFAGVIRSYAQG